MKKSMKKGINIAILSVLSVGLFASALTAAPHSISPDQPKEIVAQLELQQHTEENKATDTSTVSVADQGSTASPSVPSSSVAPRPRAQFPSVSRGTVSQNTAAPSPSSKAGAIISTAKQYLGVKYVWGGTTPSGFDCSGFTQYVFAQQGISLPRVSGDQYSQGRSVAMSNLQPGDLIFFSLDGDNTVDHVGIYSGNGQFINASTSKGVTIYSLGSYWKSHCVGAKRVL